MSNLSVILQVCNDYLVCQMLLWYFFRALSEHNIKINIKCLLGGTASENSLKIVIVPLKSGLLATM